jgi:hypothetical protein
MARCGSNEPDQNRPSAFNRGTYFVLTARLRYADANTEHASEAR